MPDDIRHPPLSVTERVYVIGEVHGQADLLADLLGRIDEACRDSNERCELVVLGNMLGRGPHGRAVVAHLRALAHHPLIEPVFILGTQEALLLGFLAGESNGEVWLRKGGVATAFAYGVDTFGPIQSPEVSGRLRHELLEAMGDDLAFLRGLTPFWLAGNLFFSHRGAEPDLPLDRQPREALLYGPINDASTPRSDGFWLVCGDPALEDPLLEPGYLRLDTDSCVDQRLHALNICPSGQIALMASGETDRPDAMP